jgi:D-alanyl-lipoteichoic acid acyltransferase DltB (MBOAT superfamily)
MLFSNPDYPLFLVAVFFLYALSRRVDMLGTIARGAVMVLLGDVVFVLVSKDAASLWDPIGGALLQLAGAEDTSAIDWRRAAMQWPVGAGVLATAIAIGARRGAWIASDRGQAWIARGFVAMLALIGAIVMIASANYTLEATTQTIARTGHVLVLFVLGVGIGAAQRGAPRTLGRVIVLFVASGLFYQAWASAMPGPYRYLLALLLGTIVLDYYLALWIERAKDPFHRKWLLIVSLCSNLGILFFFKYTDFVAQDVLHLPVSRLHLILPAGISFHTFQSLSYTIDVYRGQLRATRSVVKFATFVLFFPQLVAGPIVRAQDLLPQLDSPPRLQLEAATNGLYRIVVGLFKKIALADTLALAIVDRVFEAPERFSAIEVIAGVYAYALQIYLDFSAYSDIAIGSAQVLGFSLPENFRTPYRSSNLQEFWRRWHMSLSTWLRDYLYVTLGGNRGAPWRTYLNLALTMVLGGLWHGASWTFVVWGALHGFGLAVTRYFQRRTAHDPEAARRLVINCVLVAIIGFFVQRLVFYDAGAWTQLVVAWLYLTPLWAVATAWLGADRPRVAPVAPPASTIGVPWRELWRHAPQLPDAPTRVPRWTPEALRLAMCATGVTFLCALAWWPSWTWIPLAAATWGLAIAADVIDGSLPDRFEDLARRALGVVLVFNYVCLAWIFFRATSFDNALAVLRQLGDLDFDHANLVPIVTVALVVGFVCHFFPDGTFRWLRTRFVALPAWAQGASLAACALVLRELGHAKIVPFIYFQF